MNSMEWPRTHRFRPVARVGIIALAVGMVACEDEVTGPLDELIEGQITFDATDPAAFQYVSFADGGGPVTVTDPHASTEWVVAFRRFSAKLNGGVAGGGDVAGFNVENNAAATSDEVTAFTTVDADAAWESVTEADIGSATFVTDGIVEDFSGPWFRFDPISSNLVANTGAAWKVRESGDGFSIFRVSELEMAGQTPSSVTIEYRHQDAGATLAAAATVEVDLTGGTAYVSLSTGAVVTPDTCNWDLSVSPQFSIAFNGDCDAGTFPLDATEDFTALTQADDAPEYGPFLSVISGAIPSTVDDASGIFWYNIEGNNRLWPTYNVFLLELGADVYKVQVLDYYNATGDSGFPTIRFEQLR